MLPLFRLTHHWSGRARRAAQFKAVLRTLPQRAANSNASEIAQQSASNDLRLQPEDPRASARQVLGEMVQ